MTNWKSVKCNFSAMNFRTIKYLGVNRKEQWYDREISLKKYIRIDHRPMSDNIDYSTLINLTNVWPIQKWTDRMSWRHTVWPKMQKLLDAWLEGELYFAFSDPATFPHTYEVEVPQFQKRMRDLEIPVLKDLVEYYMVLSALNIEVYLYRVTQEMKRTKQYLTRSVKRGISWQLILIQNLSLKGRSKLWGWNRKTMCL